MKRMLLLLLVGSLAGCVTPRDAQQVCPHCAAHTHAVGEMPHAPGRSVAPETVTKTNARDMAQALWDEIDGQMMRDTLPRP